MDRMDRLIAFFSIFQNVNIPQKIGTVVTLLLSLATALYAILPKVIQALQSVQQAVPPPAIQ